VTIAFDSSPDVRFAVPADEDAMFDLGVLAHAEAAQHSMDEEKVRAALNAMCHRRSAMAGVIGPEGGPLKGMVLLQLDCIWYSPEFQLLELTNFVHPEHRRSHYAKQLINFAKRCSDNLDIDLMIGVVSNERTKAKVRLYERQLPNVGSFFCYHPDKGSINGSG
jgi:hypothetical protein